jgi:hypothetical protein
MLSAFLPFARKDENELAVRGVCTVSTDVENVVKLGFFALSTRF